MEWIISIYVGALVLFIFFLRQPGVPATPQPSPDDVAKSASPPQATEAHDEEPDIHDAVSSTHDPSSPLPRQAHSGGLNATAFNNRVRDSSLLPLHPGSHNPIPNITSLASGSSTSTSVTYPVNGAHNPTHVDSHDGPFIESRISPSLPPAEPHAATSTGPSLFHGAQHFVMTNSVINVQGESDIVIREMKTLSDRVIEGAEYDSSLRDPPPQCHPGTRVELLGKILAWFQNGGREKALLWLNGPAGVGKSAVIQTVAESLAESNSIGATLFFSRLNKRNVPQRVFITIAFQLATRIPAYRIYITGRIALDPSLLKKGMKEQFRVFIAEPFGNDGIRKGEGPWAVLLDGLDECEGIEEQSRIIGLISEFVLEFPNSPLIWTIASRPEPHIVATFNNEAVTPSRWSEYVPIDSTQACRDVEHYLDARFKAMREQFPHIPSTWPSESQLLKLSNGARGLFVFARTAVRFMEDPNYADPVSRLNLIIFIIDGLGIKVIADPDHPFALLDALYTQILASIPPSVWSTAKRLLGFVICVRPRFSTSDFLRIEEVYGDGHSYALNSGSRSLMGASLIFGLELNVTYGSLHKLHSVLDIPVSKESHGSPVKFLHASFGDYLTDRVRSKDFCIDQRESVDDIVHGLFELHIDGPRTTEWKQHAFQLSKIEGSSFYKDLKKDALISPNFVLTGRLLSKRERGPFESEKDRSDYLDALSRTNLVEVYGLVFHGVVAAFLFELWNTFRQELESSGRFSEVPLRDLKVDHLNFEKNIPAFAYKETLVIWSSLNGFVPINNQLQTYLTSHPERPALIYGSLPQNRIAFFAGSYEDEEGYFCFPYPY